jgi:hypothetical protein
MSDPAANPDTNLSGKPLVRLGSEASEKPFIQGFLPPGAYASPAQFLQLPKAEHLAMLSQLSAQVLQDPIATQQLCDRVCQLMQQELVLTQERHGSYRRRHPW